jgi:hypothetical protein
MKIVVCEYPKSGGSWLASMLATALELPARDLYFTSPGDLKGTTLSLHPWYKDTTTCELPDSCIIKSHERADTKLHPENSAIIHLIRDCRDVCVSKYFYERNFRLSNENAEVFKTRFADYVRKTAKEWAAFVGGWLATDVVTCHYEKFLSDPKTELKRLLAAIGSPSADERVDLAVRANSRDNMRRAFRQAYSGEDFVRKGISGDWLNYFSVESSKDVDGVAGSVMQRAGYTDTGVECAAAANLQYTANGCLQVWELGGFKTNGVYRLIGQIGKSSEELQRFLNARGWREDGATSLSSDYIPQKERLGKAPDPQTPDILFLGPARWEAADPIIDGSSGWAKHGLILSESSVTLQLMRKLIQAGFIMFATYGECVVFAWPGRSTPKPALADSVRGWTFALRATVRNMLVRKKRSSSHLSIKSD